MIAGARADGSPALKARPPSLGRRPRRHPLHTAPEPAGSTRAIILAGGRGTRLAPYTAALPKPLMPLGDQPILGTLLRQLAAQGITDVTLAVGYLGELIQAYCDDGSRFGVRTSYTVESEPLGTVGPLALVPGLTDTFLVLNGDLLCTLSFRDLLEHHRRSRAIATLSVIRHEFRIEFGVVDLDEGPNGNLAVVGMREKPAMQATVSMGVYAFEPAILSYIPQDSYLDLPDLVLRLLEDGQPVGAYAFDGYWLDIGRHSEYEQALADFQRIRPHLLPASPAAAGDGGGAV